jgi:REP element-mobilizing transposase RayT
MCADSRAAADAVFRAGYRQRMPRRARALLGEEGTFQVTARGVAGCDIFRSGVDRLDFADLLWDTALEYEWECLVACQIGTHYHVLLNSLRESLSRGMRKLNGAYARRFNVRHGRRGHLFEARFSSWLIEDEPRLEATIPYILWNPVRANLRSLPTEWEWSWLTPSRASAMGAPVARLNGAVAGQPLRGVEQDDV